MILCDQTLEFWPYFTHTGILTSSFETMEFWSQSYKHLPLITLEFLSYSPKH